MFSLPPSVSHRATCAPLAAILVVMAVLGYSSADAAPVAVRFLEGVARGYVLVLKNLLKEANATVNVLAQRHVPTFPRRLAI